MARPLPHGCAREIESVSPLASARTSSRRYSSGRLAIGLRIDVRQVGDDHVVALAGNGRCIDSIRLTRDFKTVVANVAARDSARVRAKISMASTVDSGKASAADRQAARNPCQVERALDRPDRRSGVNLFAQQFGDNAGTARHDDAAIDVEAVLAEPGLVRQVGRRQAFADRRQMILSTSVRRSSGGHP